MGFIGFLNLITYHYSPVSKNKKVKDDSQKIKC